MHAAIAALRVVCIAHIACTAATGLRYTPLTFIAAALGCGVALFARGAAVLGAVIPNCACNCATACKYACCFCSAACCCWYACVIAAYLTCFACTCAASASCICFCKRTARSACAGVTAFCSAATSIAPNAVCGACAAGACAAGAALFCCLPICNPLRTLPGASGAAQCAVHVGTLVHGYKHALF